MEIFIKFEWKFCVLNKQKVKLFMIKKNSFCRKYKNANYILIILLCMLISTKLYICESNALQTWVRCLVTYTYNPTSVYIDVILRKFPIKYLPLSVTIFNEYYEPISRSYMFVNQNVKRQSNSLGSIKFQICIQRTLAEA